LCGFYRHKNYPKYGITKKSDTAKNDARSLFSKRFGSYVTSHGYAEAQAKEFIHTAALTGNGLVCSKFFPTYLLQNSSKS
jgi:hypothetical protein